MDQNKTDSFNIIREAIFDMRIAVDDVDEVAFDLFWDMELDASSEDVEYYFGKFKQHLSTITEAVDKINKELGLLVKEKGAKVNE